MLFDFSKELTSQIASLAVNAMAMYSASVEDAATVDCRLLAQLTAPPDIMNT